MILIIAESIVALLVHEIVSSVIEEIKFLRNVRDEVFALKIKHRYLQIALKDAGECNEVVRVHRDEIGKLAKEIDNVIESYALICRQKSCNFRPVRVHRIGVKIDRIRTRIQEAIGAFNDVGSLGGGGGVVDDDHVKEERGSCSCDMRRSRL